MKINTQEEFTKFVEDFKKKHKMPFAYALGIGYCDEKDEIVTARFLSINFASENQGALSAIMHASTDLEIKEVTVWDLTDNAEQILFNYFEPFISEEGHNNIDVLKLGIDFKKDSFSQKKRIVIVLYPDRESLVINPPVNHIDVMCRLTMVSHHFFSPNEINLDNAFGLLKKLYYTPQGALTKNQWDKEFMKGNYFQAIAIDKFPPLYWGAPLTESVRIANPARVRLGACLAPGTTVMHEGFVNFNAGTLGPCMIEGRISQGVVVGKDCDLGGGCSIMGTLSGGGKQRISIGDNCLLGANSGIGISLGDRCTVEAGLYITSGMKVRVYPSDFDHLKNKFIYDANLPGKYIKVEDLSGANDMLFIRNSKTGVVELHFNMTPNRMNKILHT